MSGNKSIDWTGVYSKTKKVHEEKVLSSYLKNAPEEEGPTVAT